MSWREFARWQGVALCTIVVVAILWLAVTGQLTLYIHPRYLVFTVVMAIVALALTVLALVRRPVDHDPADVRRGASRILPVLGGVLTTVLALSILVLPPATLTAATLDQRDLNGSAAASGAQTVEDAVNAASGASLAFTVLDWASLLRQTSDSAFYADKPADIVGFIATDPDDPENVFYVSRFVVTCCAVDAQPVGVPVYLPGWQSSHAVDDWVHVTGSFVSNASITSQQPLVLQIDDLEQIEQPDEPYLF